MLLLFLLGTHALALATLRCTCRRSIEFGLSACGHLVNTRLLLLSDPLDLLVFGETQTEELAETSERRLRCLALGFFLRASRPLRETLLAGEHLRDERAIMRRTLSLDKFVSRRYAILLQHFLKLAFRVFGRPRQIERHPIDERVLHEPTGLFDAGIEIECRNDSLIDVLER